MMDWLAGIDQHIQRGSEPPPNHIHEILRQCETNEKMLSWVAREGLQSCIQTASGFQDALQKFHQCHSEYPNIKGMIYLNWDSTQSKSKLRNFKGSFGGRVTYNTTGSKPPVIGKRNAAFIGDDKHGNKKYVVAWSRMMVHQDPNLVKRVEVCSITQESTGSGSPKTIFILRGENPFGTESGRHAVRTVIEYDQIDLETECAGKPSALEAIATICKDIEGYYALHKSTPQEIELQGFKEIGSREAHEGCEERLLDILNSLMQKLILKMHFVEDWVMEEKLNLYNVCCKEEADTLEPLLPDLAAPQALEESDEGPSTLMDDLFQQTLLGRDDSEVRFERLLVDDEISTQNLVVREQGHILLHPGAQICEVSDIRCKQHIEKFGAEAYKKVLKIMPVFYSFRGQNSKSEDTAGFIAQQVQEHIRMAVHAEPGGQLYLKSDKLLPFIVSAIQAHDKELSKQGGQLFLIFGALLQLMEAWEQRYGRKRSSFHEFEEDGGGGREEATSSGHGNYPNLFEEEDARERDLFYAMDPPDRAHFLLEGLRENISCHGYFLKICHETEKKVLWRIFVRAKKEHAASPDERTLGGHFLKLVKQLKKNKDLESELEGGTSEVIQSMRGYQKDVVNIMTEGWSPEDQHRNENYLVVAPTGSGKTRIFIECARYALEALATSKVVVIVPNVPLSKQHEASFLKHGFAREDWRVESFSSENQINRGNWLAVLNDHSVMVMTAQTLLNQLDDGVATLQQVHLLILDEVHHTKSQSPYQKIMDHYQNLQTGRPKVLGFSASPTSASTTGATYNKLKILQKTVDAQIIYIREDNQEIQEYVPTPNERIVKIKLCDHDLLVRSGLKRFVGVARQQAADFLKSNLSGSGSSDKVLKSIMDAMNHENPEGALQDCFGSIPALKGLSGHSFRNMYSSAELMMHCQHAIKFLDEFGHEKALSYCGMQCARLYEEVEDPQEDGLLRRLISQLCCTLPISDGEFMTSVFRLDIALHGTMFPKFLELLKFLEEEYGGNADTHGIIFTETRSGVYFLAEMLRNDPCMSNINFIEYTGHGKTKAARDAKLKGMKGGEQEKRLRAFRKEGRKVLVATAAAEEGLDVSNCEFVVRYTAPQTGIQRVQSKGRSRKAGSIYLALVVEDTQDQHLDEKSRTEENNLTFVLSKMNAIII